MSSTIHNDIGHFQNTENISTKLQSNEYCASFFSSSLRVSENTGYITGKKLNKSDDTIIAAFETYNPQVIDAESGIRGITIEKPNSTNYLYFSEKLQKEQLESRARKVVREIKEAQAIQKSIDKNKSLPKRFRINNLLVDVDYSIQTKLLELSEEDAVKLLEEKFITGREGFFCLKSSKKLTLPEALLTYRKKDSIEKIFNSLKNEIEIKPLRVWTDNSIYGALIIGFIAQLFVSLIRFEIPELKHTSTKFIKQALLNLTVTIDSWMRKTKKYIHSNFDAVNTMILRHNWAMSGSGRG